MSEDKGKEQGSQGKRWPRVRLRARGRNPLLRDSLEDTLTAMCDHVSYIVESGDELHPGLQGQHRTLYEALDELKRDLDGRG